MNEAEVGDERDSLTGCDQVKRRRVVVELMNDVGFDPGPPPDNTGCWQYDLLADAWVLDGNAGRGCLRFDDNVIFCGVGICPPWPDTANTGDGMGELQRAKRTLDHPQSSSPPHLRVVRTSRCDGLINEYRNAT